MKKVLALAVAVFLALNSVYVSSAASEKLEAYNTREECAEEFSLESYKRLSEEEKFTCKATLEDDFEDNSVLVLFNNETSLKLKRYQPSDFKGVDIASVEDLKYNKIFGEKVTDFMAESLKLLENTLIDKYSFTNAESAKFVEDSSIIRVFESTPEDDTFSFSQLRHK